MSFSKSSTSAPSSQPVEQEDWYRLSVQQAAGNLGVDVQNGLSTTEAQLRLQKYGPNVLAGKKKESGLHAFVRQYRDFMQLILVVAALLSFIFTAKLDITLVLLLLTIFNAVLGLKQESKAQASTAALEARTMKKVVKVRRNGQEIEAQTENLVPAILF
jgi:Ca2+-transporting ATPase